MKSERLGHSSSSRGGLSGLTDDSSVVSLKALVAKASPTLSAARANSYSLEDSGLIDLKKLMANAPPSSDALPPVLAPSEAGLFDVPEITLASQVARVSDASNEMSTKDSSAWAKWLGAVTLVVLAGVGTLSILHARKAHVSDLQGGVAAAAPTATSGFVEAPRPIETTPAAITAPLIAPPIAPETTPETATETQAPATSRRSRKAAVQTPSRDKARQETTTPKVDAKQPPPPPCDLMCEIQRAARKKQ